MDVQCNTRRSALRVLLIILLLIAIPDGLRAQRSALTVGRSLDQLALEADRIVHGSVTSVKVEPHPQFSHLMTVVVSMDVQETLKGPAQRSLQFRQYVWDMRDRATAAGYGKGQELLLMLGPVSQYGLTSPVGLEQGRFRVLRDSSGQMKAVNGRGNAGLFQQIEARAQARGVKLSPHQMTIMRQPRPRPIALSDLKDAIRAFARAQ